MKQNKKAVVIINGNNIKLNDINKINIINNYKIYFLLNNNKIYKNNNIFVLNNKKDKLFDFYTEYYIYAVKKIKADVIIDINLKINNIENVIIKLLNKIENGFDYVLFSRYNIKNNYYKNINFINKVILFFKNLILRFLIFFPFKEMFYVTDPFSEIKAIRIKDVFNKLNLDNLKNNMKLFNIELLLKMIEINGRIIEIPLCNNFYNDNTIDKKKINEKNISIINLRYKEKRTRKFLKFGIVGFVGYLVNAFFTELFFKLSVTQIIAGYFINLKYILGLNILSSKSAWASGIGIEISIIGNYIFNNLWTFRSNRINKIGKFILKLFQFNLTSIGAIILEFLCVGIITLIFGDTVLIRQIAIILSIGFLIIPYNWFMYNKVIWKKNKKETVNG